MASDSSSQAPGLQSRKPNARKRAQLWMTKGGLVRDDSDDELGEEDHPWEWIYDTEVTDDQDSKPTADSTQDTPKSMRRRSVRPNAKRSRKIIGARMGSFECALGQVVLLKSPEPGKDWIGIITEFLEQDDDDDEIIKSANIMWFASPDEFMSTKNKRRSDALPNEQYLTADFNVNPLTSINGRATVMSKDAFYAKYPGGVPPKGKEALADFNKCIVCRRGVNQVQGRYTEEFIWEEVYREDRLFDLIDMIKSGLKVAKKRKQVDNDYVESKSEENVAPSTPRKRQKVASSATPQSRRQKSLTTPTHKRIVVKKPLEFTPLGTRILSPSQLASPYRQARTLLHVSTVPQSLPCRKTEFDAVYSHLSAAIMEGTGTCIYISGTPGTGKTATVREVVAQLNAAVLAEEMDDFIFVEINGMKVTDPHQSYSLLWEALKGDRVSPSHALDLLEREFSHPSPRRVSCVVLMDELDQLVTKNQSVMYNFFNWPALRHSRLIVLAVANTMDLPERTLSNKISSRLGLTRITFPGYKHTDLMEIISTRLANVPGNIVDADAIQFASRKVAAVSGDARRALDICRRAVEIAEQQANEAARKEPLETIDEDDTESMPPTPSKTPARKDRASNKNALLPSSPQKRPQSTTTGTNKPIVGRVTIATIKQAIQEATSTPLQQSLRCLPLAAKLFLAALLARVRRTGISETTVGDVIDEAKRIADAAVAVASAAGVGIREFLLVGGSGARVRALGSAAMELMNSGVLALEHSAGAKGPLGSAAIPHRGDRSGKVRLRVAAEDVRSAFCDDAEAKGLGLGIEQ
ncbi:origin recognition complex subunit 1 [Aspergillus brunneoviolaceus CBS 621.78]|uniref:Origin recognition complex subunit Orc1 n=1 Tax=Aspergillus brunneoviolaceus CBS 621.78 TaxID=1450534 RepID=A0ACD1GG10_9EURO|nr:putative origin recognition complex subunit Orc1 [Aspergillus brunneoviolaceus CBS 621.78]RAH48170.1 putative origin recognition complex subunit Orc1 [Aspergillus brunneoviolaceus CBS 621.78]